MAEVNSTARSRFAKSPAQSTSDQCLTLEGDNLERFRAAVHGISDARIGLIGCAALFPRQVLPDTGQIDVQIAIEAFSTVIEKRLTLLCSILDGEDEPSAGKKGGAA